MCVCVFGKGLSLEDKKVCGVGRSHSKTGKAGNVVVSRRHHQGSN